MSIIESVKNTAFTAAVNMVLNYLEKEPETNIPKAMNLIDKALPDGWYESQRAAFRKAIAEKGNWYELILKAYQLDTGVRKTLFQNFIINSALKGGAVQEEMRKKENCNIPWAVLLDPTSHMGRRLLHRVGIPVPPEEYHPCRLLLRPEKPGDGPAQLLRLCLSVGRVRRRQRRGQLQGALLHRGRPAVIGLPNG